MGSTYCTTYVYKNKTCNYYSEKLLRIIQEDLLSFFIHLWLGILKLAGGVRQGTKGGKGGKEEGLELTVAVLFSNRNNPAHSSLSDSICCGIRNIKIIQCQVINNIWRYFTSTYVIFLCFACHAMQFYGLPSGCPWPKEVKHNNHSTQLKFGLCIC